MDTSALPLTGAIIIDLSDECLSLTGRFLADFGAEVIRVEAAGGDALRIAGPHLADRLDPESGLRHLLHNAGKRSVALNFDAPGSLGPGRPAAVPRGHRDRAAAEVSRGATGPGRRSVAAGSIPIWG